MNRQKEYCRKCGHLYSTHLKKCPVCKTARKGSFKEKANIFLFIVFCVPFFFYFLIFKAEIIELPASVDSFLSKHLPEPIVEDIDRWDDLILNDKLPKPHLSKIIIWENSHKQLRINIDNTTATQYNQYIADCNSFGYIVDPSYEDSNYQVYNSEGYKLSLSYAGYIERLTVQLDAPMEMHDITWPSNGIAKQLPVPQSSFGKIQWDSQDVFSVYVGKTSKDAYKDYVKACETAGFTLDYNRGENHYYAQNKLGYGLELSYRGANIIKIHIYVPEPEPTDTPIPTETPKPTNSPKPTKAAKSADAIRPEIKKALDEYEEFFTLYAETVQKAQAGDLRAIVEYGKMLLQLSDMEKALESMDDNNDMTTAELIYYIEVINRINTKMLLIN